MIKQLSSSKFLIPLMIIIALLATGAGFYISLKQSQQNNQVPAIAGFYWPNTKQLHAFNSLDQNNQAFGLEQMQGKWSFVFFGYTHCPDICPVTMSVMADAYKTLAPTNDDLQIVFVTVDPERDTTEKLADYVAYFNDRFIGLGGTAEMVESLTKQLGIAYYLNKEDSSTNYMVDHSASIFIFDPKARMVAKLAPPHQASQITDEFTTIKTFINAQN